MIEQARAIADVRAAIMIAREDPRIEADCVAEMRRACSMKEMAEVAFFRVQRGKDDKGVPQMVTGPTIDLANELSRCWRNINSGHKELSRNEQTGQSEVLAYAWDIEKNNRREQTIIVPHKRGKHRVFDTQGIREVIAGVAARVEREMIFRVLPTWFRIQAIELCHETLAIGDGKSLEQRVSDCKAAFYGIDIMADALERKIGRAVSKWTPEDIAVLTVVYKSIRRGQSDAVDEFPSAKGQIQPDNVAALERSLNQIGAAAGATSWDDTQDAPAAKTGEAGSIATAGAGEQSHEPAVDGDAVAQTGGGAATPPPAADEAAFMARATAALASDGGQGARWLKALGKVTAACPTMGALAAINLLPAVKAALQNAPPDAKTTITKMFVDAALRLGEADDDGWPGPDTVQPNETRETGGG